MCAYNENSPKSNHHHLHWRKMCENVKWRKKANRENEFWFFLHFPISFLNSFPVIHSTPALFHHQFFICTFSHTNSHSLHLHLQIQLVGIGTTRSRTLCYSLITIIIILIITIIIIIIIVVSDCVFHILYIEICMYENVKKKKENCSFFSIFWMAERMFILARWMDDIKMKLMITMMKENL